MIIQKLCCFQLQTRLGGIPNAQLTRASTDAEIAYFKKSKSSQDQINAKNETISTDITDEEDDIVLKSLKNVGLDMLELPSNNTCSSKRKGSHLSA